MYIALQIPKDDGSTKFVRREFKDWTMFVRFIAGITMGNPTAMGDLPVWFPMIRDASTWVRATPRWFMDHRNTQDVVTVSLMPFAPVSVVVEGGICDPSGTNAVKVTTIDDLDKVVESYLYAAIGHATPFEGEPSDLVYAKKKGKLFVPYREFREAAAKFGLFAAMAGFASDMNDPTLVLGFPAFWTDDGRCVVANSLDDLKAKVGKKTVVPHPDRHVRIDGEAAAEQCEKRGGLMVCLANLTRLYPLQEPAGPPRNGALVVPVRSPDEAEAEAKAAPGPAASSEQADLNSHIMAEWGEIKVFPNNGSFGRGSSNQCFWISVAHAVKAVRGVDVPAAKLKELAGSTRGRMGVGAVVNDADDVVDTEVHYLAIENLAKLLGVAIEVHVVGCYKDTGRLWWTMGAKFNVRGRDTIKIINYNKLHFEAVAINDAVSYFGVDLRATPLVDRSYVKAYVSSGRGFCRPGRAGRLASRSK